MAIRTLLQIMDSNVFDCLHSVSLEEQSLIRKSSRLGEDSRDGKHSKSTILDLSLSVSLGLIGIRRELKGVESEISRLTSRTLGLIEDSSTTSELQNEHSSEEETHAAIGHAGIVSSKGGANTSEAGTRESSTSSYNQPSDNGKHGHTAVLQLTLSHPLHRGDGGTSFGIRPYVRHDLLRPILLQALDVSEQQHIDNAYGKQKARKTR